VPYNPTVPSTTRTVGRNVATQIAGRAGGAALGLALTAVLTRALTLDGYGSLSTALAVLGLVAVAHELGATPVASRALARDPGAAGPLLGTVAAARAVAAVPLAGAGAVALVAAGEGTGFALAAGGAIVLVLLGRSFESVDVVFHVAQRMARSVAASLAGRAGFLGAALGLAGAGIRRPDPYLAAAVAGTAVSAVLRLRLAGPLLASPLRFAAGRLRSLLREAAPTATAGILMAGYLHADALVVRGLRGAREAALYNAPYRLFVLGAGLAGMVMVSAAPVLSARWIEDRAGFRRGVARLLGLGVLVAAPVAAIVAWQARPLLGALFGLGYEEAAGTLALLAVAAAAAAAGTVATSALICADRAIWTARLAGVALVVNVGLDLALVPSMGGRGAAVATLVTEALVAVLAVGVLARVVGGAR
jgi:O-antigen/teichoic acid export membrane protein